jgi:hypothetical protein
VCVFVCVCVCVCVRERERLFFLQWYRWLKQGACNGIEHAISQNLGGDSINQTALGTASPIQANVNPISSWVCTCFLSDPRTPDIRLHTTYSPAFPNSTFLNIYTNLHQNDGIHQPPCLVELEADVSVGVHTKHVRLLNGWQA